MAKRIQQYRGLEKNLPVLMDGEFGFTTDTKRVFIGSSSGNVELTKKNDLNERGINVKDFGAKGDGVADDTQAIQDVIDFVGANGGGTVLVPIGVYRHSTINLNVNDIKIVGEGYNSVLVNDSETSGIKIGKDNGYVFHCIIKDIGMYGNNTSQSSHGIEMIGANPAYITIENVKINNFGGHGIYGGHNGHVNNVEISRCFIEGNQLDGINLQYGVGQINAIWIHHNNIVANNNGILFFGNNVVVENNTIQANRKYAVSLSDDSLSTIKSCFGSAIKSNYTEGNASDVTENASIIGIFTGYDSNLNTNKFLRNLVIEDNYFGENGGKFRSVIYAKDLKSSAPKNKSCVVTSRNNYAGMPLVSFNKATVFGEGWIIDENYWELVPDDMLVSLPSHVEVRGFTVGEFQLAEKLQKLKDDILDEIVDSGIGSGESLYVNVKDFGAKGDGVADDTTAINNAIATLSNQGGGVLSFDEGTYLISNSIAMKSDVTLLGIPRKTVILASANTFDAIGFNENVFNTEINGFIIRSANGINETTRNTGIHYSWYTIFNSTIRNVAIENFYNGIDARDYWKASLVENVHFVNCRTSINVEQDFSGNTSSVTFINIFSDNPVYRHLDLTYVEGFTFIGCRLQGDGTSADSVVALNSFIKFLGCRFDGMDSTKNDYSMFDIINGSVSFDSCFFIDYASTGANSALFEARISAKISLDNCAFEEIDSTRLTYTFRIDDTSRITYSNCKRMGSLPPNNIANGGKLIDVDTVLTNGVGSGGGSPQYGGKFEWRYNPVTNSLDLVVLD